MNLTAPLSLDLAALLLTIGVFIAASLSDLKTRDLQQVLACIWTWGGISLRSQDNLRPRCIAHLGGFGGCDNSRSLPPVPVQRDGRSRQQSTDVSWFSFACITKFLGPVLAAPLRILSLPHRYTG